MTEKQQPLVSIVMPSYNQVQFLEEAITSILDQPYSNLELIVQDGKSHDGTILKLRELSLVDSRLKFTSEHDEGPADAINRAFQQVRGTIIGWLNSDDVYARNAIPQIVRAFERNRNWIMCYGQAEHIDQDGVVMNPYPTQKPDAKLSGFRSGCYICQPTVFFKSSMLSLIGKLDQNLCTSFDYDLWIRAFSAFPNRIGFIDTVLARSRLHEGCITRQMRETVAIEGLMLSKKYLGKAEVHWAVTYLEEYKSENNPIEDFVNHANTFLRKVQHYLEPGQLNQLRESLGISPEKRV